jgi:hypothetical protein
LWEYNEQAATVRTPGGIKTGALFHLNRAASLLLICICVPFAYPMGLYTHKPSLLVRWNARAQSDLPMVMRWLNQDTMLLASHSSDCLSS